MNLDDVIQLQVLKRKAASRGGVGRDSMNEALLSREDIADQVQLKQMCAKVSQALHQDVDSLCSILDLSKREFIENALIETCRRSWEVIERNGGLAAMGFEESTGAAS